MKLILDSAVLKVGLVTILDGMYEVWGLLEDFK